MRTDELRNFSFPAAALAKPPEPPIASPAAPAPKKAPLHAPEPEGIEIRIGGAAASSSVPASPAVPAAPKHGIVPGAFNPLFSRRAQGLVPASGPTTAATAAAAQQVAARQQQAAAAQQQLLEVEAFKQSRLKQMKKCHLHVKPLVKKCKICKKYEEDTAKLSADLAQLGVGGTPGVFPGIPGGTSTSGGFGGAGAATSVAPSVVLAGVPVEVHQPADANLDSAREYTNARTFNLPSILLAQVQKSDLFKKEQMATGDVGRDGRDTYVSIPDTTDFLVRRLVDELDSAEIHFALGPNATRGEPTLFSCLLVRMLHVRPSTRDLIRLLTCRTNPYVRVMGRVNHG